MFHFLQFRSNFLNPGFDLDEASALLHGGNQRDGLIKGRDGLSGLLHGDDEGGFLGFSGLLTVDEETSEVLDVGEGKAELFLSIVEEAGGVDDSLGGGFRGLGVEGDL